MAPGARGGARGGGAAAPARGGNLKVVTTQLRPGYVRKNGAPYSDRTVVTEYFDSYTLPNGDQWFTVTTKVDDPVYFSRPLHHDLGVQETTRRDGLESDALLCSVISFG